MKIGIIGAMSEEIEDLKNRMNDYTTEERAGFTFYKGILNKEEIILLLSGIGKVNAAMGTTLMIERYSPDCIINTGSAGGFSADLSIGDVVISTEVRHHDVDATVFGYEYGQVPRMPAAYIPNNILVEIAEKVVEKLDNVGTMKGLIATGDSFMHKDDHIHAVREKLPTIMAAEMEAAAIAQCCHNFAIPFVIIRAISDITGDKDNQIEFEEFLKVAAVNSATMVREIITLINQYEIKNFGD
ncbi:5'-methylthioadenosine/S-adenosylhomocysteine nucleosidase [Spirochaeta isovalerica]|uniref:5'-methylthioadenosine/S-adenosylhomocysteine nucleosidase n=1 Tax=Spirochaeta isovalerica TaxID=150 RepID=A0A841R3J1_9SPIO|nr:5'-methylthioadenosine/S-adenosylhomocysteine nucleosidase [Spirochaeta isovalerica]MBB6478386.1 adenosylhomocysteine nucleosidase [Spirochaeta isovalerica]